MGDRMMGNFRWTPEALAAFEKRAESWRKSGTTRTHECHDGPIEGPANKLGGRPSKYGNIKAEADGQVFASKRERGRWMDLRLEERAGAIKDLKRQVVYPLEVNGIKVCDYIADFEYERAGRMVTEDAKGYRTDVFRLKSKLMLACHGIEVVET